MALRKALSYSRKSVTPFTRKSNKKNQNYIKKVPPQKIVKFKMGKLKAYENGDFKITLALISNEKILIRDNALEAIRQYVHKSLEKGTSGNYYLEVRVFPHHVLRENKAQTGAGADRLSDGMRQSFGTTMGRAAITKKNQEILLVGVNNEKAKKIASDALSKVKAKVPGSSKISILKAK
jgi:large subunit ribosomal protein L10e